jgi:hypothetical protein
MELKETISFEFYTNPKNKKALQKLSLELQEYYLSHYPVKQKTKKELREAERKAWTKYRNKVYKITQQQNLSSLQFYTQRLTLEIIKQYGPKIYLSNSYYALDHIYSIWNGFKNNIPAEQIGDISNLRYIPSGENCIKGTRNG